MPDTGHTIEVRAPIAAVWDLVSDFDYWAPMVPGYVRHERVSDHESLLTVKGNVGIFNKTVTFRVTITERVKPSKVSFSLKATNENVAGDGYFLAEPSGPDTTRVTGYLDLRPGGQLAPVVNVFMKPLISKGTGDFAATLAEKIEETYRNEQP